MPVSVRNLTSRHMFIRMNSGYHLRLSPGAVSGDLSEVELNNNPKIDKLRGKRAIALETRTPTDAAKSAAEPAAKSEAPVPEPAESKAAPESGQPAAAGAEPAPIQPAPEAAAAQPQPTDAAAPLPKKK
jgi:hypothetical protein